MKQILLSTFTFLFVATIGFSQNKTQKINANNGSHYVTTTIDYPVTGTYLFEGIAEPMVQLNADGTGILQFDDLSKSSMSWGIESFEDGTPKYQKGFNYAVYTLWYKNNTAVGADDEEQQWKSVHFSIHFQKKKMFIMGDRSKDYAE